MALLALVGVGAAGSCSDDDAVADADAVRHRLPRANAEHGGARGRRFGLAALPLGVLADAVTLEVTLAGMGVVVLVVSVLFVARSSSTDAGSSV